MQAPNPEKVKSALEAFRDELLDDDRTEFTFGEAEKLAHELRFSTAAEVIRGLKALGLTMKERVPVKEVRGFNSNSHDRWYGKGSCKTHGGSGWEQVTGFAGQEG